MCYRELEKVIADNCVSEQELSHRLGIDLAELRRKLAGEAEFTLWEIKCLTEIFSLKSWQVMLIFFDEKFPKGNKMNAG